MRISDWSSDVCSSDLEALLVGDSDAAFGFLGRAVTLSPRDPRVRAAYGRALVMSARPKDALTLFRQAVALGMLEGAVAGDRGLARDLMGDGRTAQRAYRLGLTRSDEGGGGNECVSECRSWGT